MVNPKPMQAVITTSWLSASSSAGHARGCLSPCPAGKDRDEAADTPLRGCGPPRRVGFADEFFESFCGERSRRIERDLFEGTFDVDQLRLQAGQRLTKQPQRLEQPHDIRSDAGGRTEID